MFRAIDLYLQSCHVLTGSYTFAKTQERKTLQDKERSLHGDFSNREYTV